jgi:K(+)-stimulated pyrophosphate-energized sodium pump
VLSLLKAEYRLLAIFVVIVSVVLAGITQIEGVQTSPIHSDCFCFGASLSALAGNMGNENSN